MSRLLNRKELIEKYKTNEEEMFNRINSDAGAIYWDGEPEPIYRAVGCAIVECDTGAIISVEFDTIIPSNRDAPPDAEIRIYINDLHITTSFGDYIEIYVYLDKLPVYRGAIGSATQNKILDNAMKSRKVEIEELIRRALLCTDGERLDTFILMMPNHEY